MASMADTRAVMHLEESGLAGDVSQRKRYAFYGSIALALGAAIGMMGFFAVDPTVTTQGHRFDHAMAKAFAMPTPGLRPPLRQNLFARNALPATKEAEKLLESTAPSPMRTLAVSAIKGNRLQHVYMALSMEDKNKLSKVNTEVMSKSRSMAGVTAPLDFFDPVGFCAEDISEGKLCFYREVELKHGRVAMLATLGLVVGEQFHPLFGGDIDVPSAFAFQQTPLQTFWPAVVTAIAIPEIFSVFTFNTPLGGEPWSMRTDREAGDLGFDPLGLKPKDPAELKDMQTKELNNGRLAMIAAAGMIAQELATGQKLF